jgi:hypothetical protein
MFNAIPIKIPIKLSSTLKFICKHRRLWIARAILSKKSNAIGISNPTSNYNTQPWKALAQTQNEQWNRIEHPDTNPYTYTHLSFDKGVKNIWGQKGNLFNECCCTTGIHMQKTETRFMSFTLNKYQLKVD